MDNIVTAVSRSMSDSTFRLAYTCGAEVYDSWTLSGSIGLSLQSGGIYNSLVKRYGIANGGTAGIRLLGNRDSVVEDCDIGACTNAIIYEGDFGGLKFKNCRLGTGAGNGGNSLTPWILTNSQNYSSTSLELEDCEFPPGYTLAQLFSQTNMVIDGYLVKVTRPNKDARHEWKRRRGMMYSDPAVRKSGDGSVRHFLDYGYGLAYYDLPVPSQSGVPVTVVGYLRKNAAYGSTNLPSVSLGGLDSVPATFTMTNVTDEWVKFTLTTTQNTGAPGDLTFRWSGTYNGTANSTMWLDGVYFPPFITAARHYGYVLEEKSITRKADAACTLSEVEALALPITVNHATQQITLTGAVTPSEVYQACMADLCQTANLAQPVHISLSGGSFTTSYTVVGEENLAGNFTDASGKRVTISVPNCLNKSRVQLFNVTDGVEIANVETSGTGYSLRVNYTTDKTVRLRLGYAWGTTAMLPIEAVGVLSSSGLTFLDTQVPDNVYNALGIDGGTCTEFIPDFPNLLIDVSDEDGTTSVQRLYAWAAWTQTSGPGIAAMFRAVTAQDSSNFAIDPAVVNAKVHNVRATPVTVVGGALSRTDGSSVISPTSGPIHLAPGRAYVAEIQASTFNAMVQMLQRVQTKVDSAL